MEIQKHKSYRKTTTLNKIFIFDNYMTSDAPRGDQDGTKKLP